MIYLTYFILYIGFFMTMEFAGLSLTQALVALIFVFLANFIGYWDGKT